MARAQGGGEDFPKDGRARVVIEAVTPVVDGGRFAIKRVVGDSVIVEADAFADGHEIVACTLCVRAPKGRTWHEERMQPIGNDRFRAAFSVSQIGLYRFTLRAHIDRYESFCAELARRPQDDPDLVSAWARGAALLKDAASQAPAREAAGLHKAAEVLLGDAPEARKRATALDEIVRERAARFGERAHETLAEGEWPVMSEDRRARASAWYEFFPRSFGEGREAHLRAARELLPYIAAMGFTVVYLPPISPIGERLRKGPNNTLNAGPEDVGSPWAIGSAAGGHTAIAPELGTLDDFRAFVAEAQAQGLEVALDLAFQCAPDHPYVRAHPEWFHHRPDGSIQYAENPPKKYQDIYPLDFECADWRGLWRELRDVALFWVAHGVRIFRVDNPHTKPFAFWEWWIAEVRRRQPDVLFLAEAFTRPKVMHRLAKLGFSYSYTYFTWRNSKAELTAYFEELCQGPGREYFRPHVWPNTPDILPASLQHAPRPAFIARLVLAATLSAHYGIYGPAFELLENVPREPGSEEYRDSEKYQRRQWDLARADSLRDVIARVNAIRREEAALCADASLRFHLIDNENLIAYSKVAPDMSSVVLVIVNLDPYHRQSGWLAWPADHWGAEYGRPLQMHDLLSDARYLWSGDRHYVELAPAEMPAHILRIRRYRRSERDFDYYE